MMVEVGGRYWGKLRVKVGVGGDIEENLGFRWGKETLGKTHLSSSHPNPKFSPISPPTLTLILSHLNFFKKKPFFFIYKNIKYNYNLVTVYSSNNL